MSLNAAADAIRASIRQYKQLAEYADAIERIGSLEQAEKDAKAAADVARAELAGVQKSLSDAKDKLKAAKDMIEAEAAARAQLAAESIRRAQEEAVAIKERAKTDAEVILINATARGASDKALLDAKISEVSASLNRKNAELAEVAALRDDAQKELDRLNARIDDAKARIAAILA